VILGTPSLSQEKLSFEKVYVFLSLLKLMLAFTLAEMRTSLAKR